MLLPEEKEWLAYIIVGAILFIAGIFIDFPGLGLGILLGPILFLIGLSKASSDGEK